MNIFGARRSSLAIAISLAALCLQPVAYAAETPAESASSEGQSASEGMQLPGFEWALPCESKLNSAGQKVAAVTPMLTGSVTHWDIDTDFGQLVDNLLDGALSSQPNASQLDKAVAHYRKCVAVNNVKDAANNIIPYRGFGPSSEAADVILDEKIKIKDKASAEYAKQRLIDDLHPKVVAKTMQLALAMGTKDAVRRDELVGNAMAGLEKLVGKSRAQMAYQKMDEWSKLSIPPSIYNKGEDWDVEAHQDKLKLTTKLAMDGDPVIQDIVTRLKKYNHISLASRATSKVVQGGLSFASWAAPGWVVPIALELINAGYVMATGGPEESKLIKELYYDKRVESRYRTVNEEAQLALTQYQNALNRRNPVLLVCCESILTQLVGAENINQVVGGQTLLSHQSQALTASNPHQSVQ